MYTASHIYFSIFIYHYRHGSKNAPFTYGPEATVDMSCCDDAFWMALGKWKEGIMN